MLEPNKDNSNQQLQNNSMDGKFTNDFNPMIRIIIFNSLGFFFLEFVVNYFSSQILNVSGVQVGLMWSLQTIGFVISSTFTGLIADKASKTFLILLGSFGRGTSYFIVYISIQLLSYPGIAIGMFTLGFMAGFFWIPMDSLIADKSNKVNRSSAYGKKKVFIGIGNLMGGLFGFLMFWFAIILNLGDIFKFIAMPIYSFCNFGAGIYFLKNVDENIRFSDPLSYSEISMDKKKFKNMPKLFVIGLFILLIMLFLAYVNDSIFRPFIQLFLLATLTEDPLVVLIVYLPAGIISMLVSYKLGRMIDKIDPKIGFLIIATIGASMTFLLINSSSLFQFAIILVFDQAISTSADLLIASIISKISMKHRGKILGMKSLFLNGGKIIGPLIGGLAWDAIGITAPFIISIIVELCLIPLFWISLYFIMPHLAEEIEIKKKSE